MNRTHLLLLAVFIVSLLWPPAFFLFVADYVRPNVPGRGAMRDHELQKLLNANRWVIDIPADKDGWFLELSCKEGDRIYSSGGASVRGGSTIILLSRRNTFDDRIEYAWYETSNVKQTHGNGSLTLTVTTAASGSGSVSDPLANANVSITWPDGNMAIGDCLYRGGKTSVEYDPSNGPADCEVRVDLKPPREAKQKQALNTSERSRRFAFPHCEVYYDIL